MSLFLQLALFAAAAVGLTLGGHRTVEHQLRSQMQHCACACRVLDGIWPWAQQDLRAVLKKGEQAKTPWMTSGPLVCVRAGEPRIEARFVELQQAIDYGARRRALKEGR